jgi:hypothetical protein
MEFRPVYLDDFCLTPAEFDDENHLVPDIRLLRNFPVDDDIDDIDRYKFSIGGYHIPPNTFVLPDNNYFIDGEGDKSWICKFECLPVPIYVKLKKHNDLIDGVYIDSDNNDIIHVGIIIGYLYGLSHQSPTGYVLK